MTIHNFYRLSVIGHWAVPFWNQYFTLPSKSNLNLIALIRKLRSSVSIYHTLAEMIARTLAPLRKIVSRELEVLRYDRVKKELPQSFVIHDHLECGHSQTLLGWGIFDLLDPYTTNPEVKARRHRCHPCASRLARKPMATVQAAKAGVA